MFNLFFQAPFPLPQQSLSRVTLRRELDGQLSSVQNSSQRVNSDGPSNQEVAGSSQNVSVLQSTYTYYVIFCFIVNIFPLGYECNSPTAVLKKR